MKIAMITPEVIDQPSTGYRTRLYQMQTVFCRLFPEMAFAWDIRRDRPVNLRDASTLSRDGLDSHEQIDRKSLLYTSRNIAALALHIWPSFSVKSLKNSRQRILSWIDQLDPSHVVLVHPFSTELIPDLIKRPVKVFVETQNVESDLIRQLIAVAPSAAEKLELMVRWKTLEHWEKQLFPLVNEIWMPSRDDVSRQQRICSDNARIRYVPNGLDVHAYGMRDGAGTFDIVLPAYFGHHPNVVGAKVLRDQVLPIVRRTIPTARLMLVGRDPTGAAHALQREPDVIVTGEVPDTRPYLAQAGVVAVPIFQGGGTRYKILEAFAMGLPVVTTPLGCEGLEVQDGEHLLIREISDFASAIVSIFTNPTASQELGRKGRSVVESYYSWDVVEAILREPLGQPIDAAEPNQPVFASLSEIGG
jgi:polysaccharide biosynthesis protein PslH